MKHMSERKNDFNDFRFAGLNPRQYSNKYMTMDRVNADETKIVVKVGDNHLLPTQYGFALILNYNHVVFLKSWQVSRNYYGNEVVLDKNFWNVKEFGEFEQFSNEEENLSFENWVKVAKEQNAVDQDGYKINRVDWEF